MGDSLAPEMFRTLISGEVDHGSTSDTEPEDDEGETLRNPNNVDGVNQTRCNKEPGANEEEKTGKRITHSPMVHQHNPFLQTKKWESDHEKRCIPFLLVQPDTETSFRFYLPQQARENVCGCLRENVTLGLYEWAKSGGTLFRHQEGLAELFESVWNEDGFSQSTEEVLAEVLYAAKYHHLQMKDFCQWRYKMTEEQACVILHVLDFKKLSQHGFTALFSRPDPDKADTFCTGVDPHGVIKERVKKWIQSEPPWDRSGDTGDEKTQFGKFIEEWEEVSEKPTCELCLNQCL